MERIIGKLDYDRIESQIDFYYKEDLYKAVNKLGFDKVSECIATLYYGQGLTCQAIGKLIGVHGHTVNRWMAAWGMERRSYNNCGYKWNYDRFCKDCEVDTTKGYRAKGCCWPCYMKRKREELNGG